MTRVADRNVQFVGGDDPQLRITKFPPVLMSNRDHIQSASRLGSILDRVDDSGSDQEEDKDNQNWNDRPGHLNLCATVNLSGLAAGIRCSPTELNDGVDQ